MNQKKRHHKKTLLLTTVLFLALFPGSAGALAEEEGGYLVPEAEQYVTLGEYSGLAVEKPVYTVTEADALTEMEDRLYEYAETEEVDRGAEIGDQIVADITFTVDGEEDTQIDYEVSLGYEMLGDVFDEEVLGHKAGETLSFSEAFDEDSLYDDWAGKTVDYEVTIKQVLTTVIPELDDAWVKENTEYDALDEYQAAVMEQLQEEYDQQGEDSAAASAISLAMANCTFSGYPQSLYEEAYDYEQEAYESMAELFGVSLEELFEGYGITEEDIANAALENVNQQLFFSALAAAEELSVTPEDVMALAEENYEQAGYDSPQELLDAYGEKDLALYLLQTQVGEFLLSSAKITEVSYDDYDAYEDPEEDESEWEDMEYDEWEDWEDWDEDLSEDFSEEDEF